MSTASPAATGRAVPGATSATERWHQVPRGWRVVLVIAASAVVVEFALSFAGAVYGTPSRAILGPASSLDTSESGTAALAQLLSARGHPVRQVEVPVGSASLRVPGTLFVLDPQGRLTTELATMRSFLLAGGRLVLAGRPAAGVLSGLLGPGPVPIWQQATAGLSHAGAPAPENYGASSVISNTAGSWHTGAPRARTLLGRRGGALALLAEVGHGRLVLLASSSPLDNGLLGRDDNAAFALDLAGPAGGPVAFDEYDHLKTSSGTGIAGLPGHWQAGLLLALVAIVVWILSASRRFGPPARADRELVPPRIAHVDAVATLLASGPPERLAAGAAPLREAGREQLCRVLKTRPDASDAELVARAASTALPADLVTAIISEPGSEKDLLALGRAYATISERGRWS
ncbi:MAG: DUF4350 domain-containing protein [Acidimicrobiales bacterium]